MIRGILVRNYVDTQRIEVEVIGSCVYIQGELHLFEYRANKEQTDRVERELGARRVLLHLESQIRSLAEVTYVEFKLNNWERVGMQWQPKR